MARSEARILTSIWDDDDFLALESDEQRLFMFLLSQPDLAHDGVIPLRERRWARKARGLTVADIGKVLRGLADARFVVVDEDEEELLVRSFIRRDKVYKQPNVLRAAADHLPLVKSPAIRAALYAELGRLEGEPMSDGSAEILAEMLAILRPSAGKAAPNPSPNPPDMPTDDGSDIPTPATPGERGVVKVRTTRAEDLPRTPFPGFPETPPPSASARGPRARDAPGRGTRIPPNFAITDEMAAWAAENVPRLDVRYETAQFVDWWTARAGAAGIKLDWQRTWQVWMRKEARAQPPPGRTATIPGNAQCPHHRGQPAHNCAACAGERKAAARNGAAGLTTTRQEHT